jgi:hypothetical protein
MAVASAANAQTIVKQEPGAGGMRRGEVLLVDNGKCPKGQIMQVTAGTMGSGGGGGRGGGQAVARDRKCVPRPQ